MAGRTGRAAKGAPNTENPASDQNGSVADNNQNGEDQVTTVAEPVADAQVAATENSAATEGSAEGAQPDKAEVEEVIDLSAVNSALDAILAGDLSDLGAIDFKPVIDAYQQLSRKGKAAATREMGDKSTGHLENGDFVKARVYLLANKATKATPAKSSSPKTPVDQTESVVARLAGFQLSYATLMANLPEGVSAEGLQDKVKEAYDAGQPEIQRYLAWENSEDENKGDEPDVSAAAKLALQIAFKASRKPYGKRHDVTAHIEQVFAGKPVGTFLTTSQIAKEKSEEYGEDSATASAVTARLNSDKPLPSGLTATERDGTKGVLKEAEPAQADAA